MLTTVLAVDLGGSTLKARLSDVDGGVLAEASESVAFEEDQCGRSEQQPAVWWDAFSRVAASILETAGARAAAVSAISICGFTRTQVFVDARGNPTCPAIGFRDTRAGDVAAQSQAPELNAFHPLSRLLWLRENRPDAWAATTLILEPKDYLGLRLTGRAACERISQNWLISAFEGGSESLAARLGFRRDLLPQILRPWDVVGTVHGDLPGPLSRLAGARVFCGSNDTWTAVAGLGALRPGHAYCISGSSEVLGLLSRERVDAEGLVTLSWGEGLWHIGGPGQNGTSALAWVVDCLDPGTLPFAQRLDRLLGLPGNDLPLLFHPYLHGERTPFWDRDLRGAFLGLTAGHGPRDMVRAVMEGVAFLNRLVLERAEAATGLKVPDLRIAGGGARNATWNQIRADVLGRRVAAASEPELGLVGCLVTARVGLGLSADMAAAAEAVAPRMRCFEPDDGQHERLNRLYEIFRDTHEAVARASHRLASVGQAGPHGIGERE